MQWHPSTSIHLSIMEKKIDDINNLSKVYKLQSNNPQNKKWVKIHMDNSGYSIKFTVDKTFPEFNKGAENCELTWVNCELTWVNSFTEFKNVLQGQHRIAWKQTLHEHFPEPVNAMRSVPSKQDCNSGENLYQAIQLFLQQMLNKKKPRGGQYIFLQPGGDHIFQKLMMTKPLNHLCRFEEMLRSAKALPVGDMTVPKDALKVEWFYMSFHQEDRTRYLKSRQRPCNEKLETVAEYFENIFNSQVAGGLLTKKHEKQIKFCAKHELPHKMAKRYNDKIRNLVNQHYRHDNRRHEHSYTHCRNNDKNYICCGHVDHHGHNHHYKCDDKDRKSLLECNDKAFKPCHLHGPKSQHTFKKCFNNPKIQGKKSYSYEKKHPCEAHNKDKNHISKDKESRASMDLPAPSDHHVSPSEDKQHKEDKQYHVHFKKKVKVGSHVPLKDKSVKSIVSSLH